MNAEINTIYTRTSHPLMVDGNAIQALALWLKANGARQIRTPDPRRVMSERYPVGLLSEDELQVLCELMKD
ncbi:hypothetical protein FQ186_19240 [Pseudomonas sp. ANT_H14]|uniref:hypothetical protein n=1 Tax=unclassified Pseudomonas TaxID=196821 RepID=UPI0011EBF83D|nr:MULTISPECIES: hypothetical protein [unclassified Pseudomonas]KAA0945156.1 hypothetical protein FQ182_18105 [Pseudomonas sp. ANT_H4]KAA0950850.1 hypothetical protein FQ186_19240 [Pseudomonas sp. ANT_H14]